VNSLPTVGETEAAAPRAERAERAQPRPRERAWVAFGRRNAQVLVDAVMLASAAVVADLASPHAGIARTPLPWLVASPILVIVLLRVRGLYYPRLFASALDDARAAVITTALAAMAILSARVLLTDTPWVAAQTARFWVFASGYLLAGRLALNWSTHTARVRGETFRPTLIVGAGRVGQLAAHRLLAHPEFGLKPVGFLDKDPLEGRPEERGLPVLGASWDLERVVEEHGIEHVLVSFSRAPTDVLLRLMRRCQQLGVSVSFVPRLFELFGGRISIEHLGGLPLVAAHPANPKSWQFVIKYALDRVAAALLIVVFAPVLLGSAIATWLSVGRPILFRQERVGRDHRSFDMLKFRTMRDGSGEDEPFALADGLAPGGVEGADRRTRVGTFMRRLSLDEFPQLFNVLKGEMSLVGPRPERPLYVSSFEQNVYRYGDRHRVKSGITGWAQVHGLRGQTSLADRVEWDNFYIENWSLWLDVKILLLTGRAIVSPRGE
jgi:exopolysaccharide biosynthesis polyprenyl glycosylphosphotransferase